MLERASTRSGDSITSTLAGLALGASVIVACAGRPVPLVARAGTTVGLAIAGESVGPGNTGLEFGTSTTADRQRGYLVFQLRQGLTVVATLPTRIVTKVLPDSAGEAGLAGTAPMNSGNPYALLHQAMALVDIPSNVAPGSYRVFIHRSSSPSGPSLGDPDPSDSPLYSLEVIGPQNDADFTPFDHEEALGAVFAATQTQLDSIVPKPKLLLELPTIAGDLPAAATLELGRSQPHRALGWDINRRAYRESWMHLGCLGSVCSRGQGWFRRTLPKGTSSGAAERREEARS